MPYSREAYLEPPNYRMHGDQIFANAVIEKVELSYSCVS